MSGIETYDHYDYNDISWEVTILSTQTWTVAEAKAKFSELIERAKSEGPQTITKHGRTTAVIVAADQWEKRSERKGSLAEFFMASPLRGSGIKIKRLRGGLRRVEL